MASTNPPKPSGRTWGKSLNDAPKDAGQEGAQEVGQESAQELAPRDDSAPEQFSSDKSAARPPASPTGAGRPLGPALIVLGRHSATPPIALTRPAIVIGSRSNARIHLVSSKISRAHALLIQDSGVTYIRDLASRTGVQINDEPVREALLHDGDIIGVGSFRFRFVAGPNALSDDQEPPAPAAELVPLQGGPALPIEQRVTLIGRRHASDVPLLEESASTAHAALFRINGHHAVRDLGSRTGTYVNGISTRQHELRPGDVIRIGETEFRYQAQAQVDLAEAEARIADLAPPAPSPRALTPTELAPPQTPEEFAPAELEPQAETELGPAPVPQPREPAEAPIAIEPAVEAPPIPVEPEIELLPSGEAPHTDAELDRLRFAEEIASTALAPEAPAPELETPQEVSAQVFPPPLSVSAVTESELEAAAPRDLAEPTARQDQAIEEPPLELAPPAVQPAEPMGLELAPEAPVEPAGVQPLPPVAPPADSQRVPVSKTLDRPIPIATQLAETIAPTEPTPESAMPLTELAQEDVAKESLEPAAQAPTAPLSAGPQTAADAPPDVSSLSDTQFNRAVREFTGSGLGDLVTEPPIAAPAAPSTKPPLPGFAPKPAAFIPLPPPASRPGTASTPLIAPGSLGGFSGGQAGPRLSPAPPILPSAVPPLRTPTVSPPPIAPAAIGSPTIPPPAGPPAVAPSRTVASPLGHQVVAPKGFAALAAERARAVQGRRLDETIPPFTPQQTGLIPRTPRTLRRQVVPLFGQTLAAPPGKAAEPPPEIVKRVAPADVDARAFAGTTRPGKPAVQPLTPMDLVVAEPPPVHEAPPESHAPSAPSPVARAEERVQEHAAYTDESDLAVTEAQDLSEHFGADQGLAEHEGAEHLSADDLVAGHEAAEHLSADDLVAEHEAASHDKLDLEQVDLADEPAASAAAEALGIDLLDEPEPLTPEQEVASTDQLEADSPTPVRARRAAVLPAPLPMPSAGDIAGLDIEEPASLIPTIDLPRLRRKRLKRAWLCLGLAPVLGAVWVMAGWELGPVHKAVDARVQFAGLEKQSRHDRGEFEKQQLERLRDKSTRQAALEKLQSEGGSTPVSPGFLDDPAQYDNVARSAAFSNEQPNLLVIRNDGNDAVGDRARLKAMTLAMYDANASLRDQAERASQKVQHLTDDIAQGTQRLAELKNQIDALQPAVDARPAAADIAAAQAQLATLQQAYETARANRMALEADLKAKSAAAQSQIESQTESQTQTPSDGPTTAPAVAVAPASLATPTTAPAGTADSQLASLQQDLTQLDRQVESARQQHQAQQDQAHSALDAAMAQFEQRVESAKQMAPESPALSAYVATAQRVLTTARSTVDDFVHQEEQTTAALSDLRTRLNDKMQQRQAQLWASDKQLTDLNNQLEIAKRQYNAALAGGLTKESQDYKAEIDLTQSEIQAREELLPQDPAYADVVAQLQQFIENQRQKLQDERAVAEKALASVQDQLQQSQPSDQTISPQQKALAADLQKGLADVSDARRQYAEASASAENDDATRKLADNRQQIIATIAARKVALANIAQQEAQARSRQEQEAELASMRQQHDHLAKVESDALAGFNSQDQRVTALKQSDADGRDAANRLADAQAERARVQAGLDQDNRDIGPAAEEANLAIVQLPINEGSDLRVAAGTDMRPLFALVGGGGAALLMLAMAGLNLLGAMRGLPLAEKQPVRGASPWSEVDYVDPAPLSGAGSAEPVLGESASSLGAPRSPDDERRDPLAGSFQPLDDSDIVSEHASESAVHAAVEPEPAATVVPPVVRAAIAEPAPAEQLQEHDEFEGLILDSIAEPLDAPPRLAEGGSPDGTADGPINGLADDETAFLEELLSTNEPPDQVAKSTNGEAHPLDDLEHPTRRVI
jgi:pSer/pThr/pTyr-binding forkhead associated (FHA) protein